MFHFSTSRCWLLTGKENLTKWSLTFDRIGRFLQNKMLLIKEELKIEKHKGRYVSVATQIFKDFVKEVMPFWF